MKYTRTLAIEPWRVSVSAPVDDFCESVFFVGNGCIGARGFSSQREKRGPQEHAIFRAGLFEYIKKGVTDMVQLPDALNLSVVGCTPESEYQALDMRRGVLTREWECGAARVRSERMACMADTQLLCQRLTLTGKRAGEVSVRAAISADVLNLPISDDQTAENTDTVRLLKIDEIGESRMALRTAVSSHTVELIWDICCSKPCEKRAGVSESGSVTELALSLREGETVTVEKRVRVLVKGEAPNDDAPDIWEKHYSAWEALWRDCDIAIEGDDELQGALRYNIFQMLCNNASGDPGVSIGARGLTHGRYKGNTFWDTDVFLFPFYMWHRPGAARNLAMYRIDRLPAAEEMARRQNLEGARYPWMCSESGLEQCESWDIGLCETHITADVTYALERYCDVTGDDETRLRALPVYAQTARYWMSRMTYEPARDRYGIFFVKGPDEYCGAAVNNTYTNYMARRNLYLGADSGLMDGSEAARVREAADKLVILYDKGRELYLQDEMFERLEPAPFVKNGHSPMYREVCFDRMQRYKALKQADVVQLMAMLPTDFTPAQKKRAFDYYEPLTLHDSTLSYGIHALLAFRIGEAQKAVDYLRRSAFLDLRDVMGNTGCEGIHMAALGATWQAFVYGMAGLWAEGDRITLSPRLPESITRMEFCVYHRGKRYRVTVGKDSTGIEEA